MPSAKIQRVFVDTNILYPVVLADLVLSSAEYGLFDLVYSDDLIAELSRVLRDIKGLPASNVDVFVRHVTTTFPELAPFGTEVLILFAPHVAVAEMPLKETVLLP